LDSKYIKTQPVTIEGVDFSKLSIVIRNNWFWAILILVLINLTAYLKIRYTPGLFQSESNIQLEEKNETSGLSIKGFVDESSTNTLSPEIEVIQSKLFLNTVLDSVPLSMSFYSIGRFLNYDLYINPPAFVDYHIKNAQVYNEQIYYKEIDDNTFTLKFGKKDEQRFTYGQRISTPLIDLTLKKNNLFKKGDELGYFFMFSTREQLLNYLKRNLTVEPLNLNAKTIRIAFKDYNPFKAQSLLRKIDTLYLQYSNAQKNLATKQKIDWLTNELHQIENKMEGFENYFENFTLQNKTNNLDEDLRSTVSLIYKIDTQRFEFSTRINEINRLNEDLNNPDLSVLLSHRYLLPEYLNKNLEAIQELVLQQEKLKLSYNEATFAYRAKQKEIDNLKYKSTNQLGELKKDLLIKLKDLNQRKSKLEQDFASMPDKSTQFSKNQRFYKLYEEFYLMLMQSKSQFEIVQAGSTSNYRILTPATNPEDPISPNKLMIAGIGATSSIIAILFFIGILYILNNKITSVNELEKVGEVPVLGIIPYSRYTDDESLLHVKEHPKSMVSEALRTMRTNLDFFNLSESKKVVTISSTVSGEGKSFIAMNLGGVMAQSHKKVVLVDLDMRKSKANLIIPIEDRSKGVSTILIGKNTWQECLIKADKIGFDFIPAGPHPPNPSELLLNGEFASLLDNLKQHYDFILLDTPPVGLVTDGIMAMKLANLSIYIFRANYSKKEFLYNLKRITSINKFTNITSVLNSLPYTGKKGYGYGYYEEIAKPTFFQSLMKKLQSA
jgi:tyrosine-protein kinase Etk/Wzc